MKKVLSAACAFGIALSTASLAADKAPTALPIHAAATYQPNLKASRIAIFLSGDGGWNLGVIPMAQAVSAQGYTVIGVDFPKYLKSRDVAGVSCIPLAADLQATALEFAKGDRSIAPGPPLLVGYSSGATAAYVALAQADPGAFAGGLSLGFGPDLKTVSPFCPGAGLMARTDPKLGYIYAPKAQLGAPWVAFQGEIDQVVSPEAAKEFTSKVKNGSIVMLPHVGHGFSVERNWMPQFRIAISRLAAPTASK